MNWTPPADLRVQLDRLWHHGVLARALIEPSSEWPLRLKLKGPTSTDLTERFEAVRAWVAEIAALPHARVEWREVRHRVQGSQRLPATVWVDSADAAIDWLGRRRDAQALRRLHACTLATLPALQPWVVKRPLQALEQAQQWERLLAVVRWMIEHPHPGIFLRQVDVAGVDSKFIESQRAVLGELLDEVLPSAQIDTAYSGASKFCQRYGFRDKTELVRFRLLDASMRVLPGVMHQADVSLDAEAFASLALPISQIFITENEANFLAFPPRLGSIVVFGAGYGWHALQTAAWLKQRDIHYWGDIDTHGFAILDQLRSALPHVRSLLMDRETLLAHELHWGEEPKPVSHDLPRLSTAEAALYDDLRDQRIRPRLRLEQERVRFGWLCDSLTRL